MTADAPAMELFFSSVQTGPDGFTASTRTIVQVNPVAALALRAELKDNAYTVLEVCIYLITRDPVYGAIVEGGAERLAKQLRWGKDKTNTALQVLAEKGFILREQRRAMVGNRHSFGGAFLTLLSSSAIRVSPHLPLPAQPTGLAEAGAVVHHLPAVTMTGRGSQGPGRRSAPAGALAARADEGRPVATGGLWGPAAGRETLGTLLQAWSWKGAAKTLDEVDLAELTDIIKRMMWKVQNFEPVHSPGAFLRAALKKPPVRPSGVPADYLAAPLDAAAALRALGGVSSPVERQQAAAEFAQSVERQVERLEEDVRGFVLEKFNYLMQVEGPAPEVVLAVRRTVLMQQAMAELGVLYSGPLRAEAPAYPGDLDQAEDDDLDDVYSQARRSGSSPF